MRPFLSQNDGWVLREGEEGKNANENGCSLIPSHPASECEILFGGMPMLLVPGRPLILLSRNIDDAIGRTPLMNQAALRAWRSAPNHQTFFVKGDHLVK